MKRLIPVLLLTILIPACGDDDEDSPTRADLPPVVQAPPPQATVPPRPDVQPVPEFPPTQVVKFNPNPPGGSSPLTFKVNQCLTHSDIQGYPLDFTYDYGDGTQKGGRGVCRNQHTYNHGGVFKGQFCVSDRVPGHRVCRNVTVAVS